VDSGLCHDYDVRAGEEIRLRTFAGFAPLFAQTPDAGQRTIQLPLLDSADFCGDPQFRWRLLPSTSPAEPTFQPRNYWRGPIWPVIDWLLWRSLQLLGCTDRAEELRRDSLGQIAADGDFAEYFEPYTGKPLGSARQSWTAAVALDWLAAGTADSSVDASGAGAVDALAAGAADGALGGSAAGAAGGSAAGAVGVSADGSAAV
jgi:hypothetical protein